MLQTFFFVIIVIMENNVNYEERPCWDNIPIEIKTLISRCLDEKSRRHLRTTDTTWFRVVHYDQFNIYYKPRYSLSTIFDRLSQYTWQIGLTFSWPSTNKLSAEAIQDQLLKLTQLTSFVARGNNNEQPNTNWIRLTTLTNLQRLDLGSSASLIPYNLLYYFTNLTSIGSISMDGITDDEADLLERSTKLQKLTLTNAKQNAPKIDHLTGLTYLDCWEHNFAIHVSSLVNLRHVSAGSVHAGNLTTLESLIADGSIMGDISRNKNLTYLHLNVANNSHQATALSSLTFLEKASVLKIGANSDDSMEDMLRMMPQNLKQLSVHGKFDLRSVTHLTNLLSLEATFAKNGSNMVNAEHFSSLSRLTRLAVGETYGALKYLPNLRDFSAWTDYYEDGSSIEDFDPSLVPNLERLFVRRHLTPVVFNRLSSLFSLKSLNIHLDPNLGFDLNIVSALSCLAELTIDTRKMTEDYWRSLQNLTNLTALSLYAWDISEHVTVLASLTNLQRLYLNCDEPTETRYFLARRFTHLHGLTVHPRLEMLQESYSQNFSDLVHHNFDLK